MIIMKVTGPTMQMLPGRLMLLAVLALAATTAVLVALACAVFRTKEYVFED